jgi:hypothetical protein
MKVEGWKIIFQGKRILEQEGAVASTSDKANFKPKLIRRDKEGHYILIKGTFC